MAKTFTFETHFHWFGVHPGVAEVDGKTVLGVAPPPEFGGPRGHWSPEDLLVSAAETCLMMTFLHLARQKSLAVNAYESRAAGTLEKTRDGLRFTQVEIFPRIEVAPGHEAMVEPLLRQAQAGCLVSKSLTCPVHVRYSQAPSALAG